MSQPSPHPAYRPDIDGLRAIAIVSVVIFHAFPGALPGGFVGVDVFFVISGYLISSILYKALAADGFSFLDFYVRRVRRIFPALLLVIFVVLLAGWTVLFPDEYAQVGKHAAAGVGFVANLVLWRETGYFDTAAELKPFLHLWSLGIEEQFYILWPLVALIAWRCRIRMGRLIVALAVVSLLACIALTRVDQASSYFLPLTRAWELLAGALLAWQQQRACTYASWARVPANVLAWAGLLLVAAALVLIDHEKAFPGIWAVLPVAGAALLIAAGPQAAVNRHLLSNRLAVGIGLISFPLYLWHWPLLSFVRIVSPTPPTQALLLAVVLAVALSWATWRLIETPVRRSSGHRTVAALVMIGVVVGGMGFSFHQRDGLPFRLKDAQAAREAGALEWNDAEDEQIRCRPLLPAGFPGRCLVGDPGRAPDAMLIGDSHANHYYWGLSKELAALGVNLLGVTEAGCPLLYDLDMLREDGPRGCRPIANAAFQHAIETPSVRTVFVAGRWVAGITGTQLKGRGDEGKKVMPVLGDPPRSAGMARGDVIAQALDDTLGRLVAAGKRVVLLESVPELDFNARECIAWTPNRFVRRIPRPDCAVSRALIDARAQEYRPLLAAVLARHPQVTVLDPVEFMCDAASCYGRRDGVLLYRDDDHLSLDGSHWVARQLRLQLAAVLEGAMPADRMARAE